MSSASKLSTDTYLFDSFDVDYPLEVDDEYWEHPDAKQRFKQPPGKPSLVTAFNLFVKLNQLLAFTLRTIVSLQCSKTVSLADSLSSIQSTNPKSFSDL